MKKALEEITRMAKNREVLELPIKSQEQIVKKEEKAFTKAIMKLVKKELNQYLKDSRKEKFDIIIEPIFFETNENFTFVKYAIGKPEEWPDDWKTFYVGKYLTQDMVENIRKKINKHSKKEVITAGTSAYGNLVISIDC